MCSSPKWTGADCSTEVDGVPTDVILSHDGLCDLNERPCENIIVFGLGFSKDFGNATCLLREFIIDVSLDTQPLRGTNAPFYFQYSI